MREREIKLVLTYRVPENEFTVNGFLLELEEQTPVILNTLLQNIFMILEERSIHKLRSEHPGCYVPNGHQPNAKKLITPFGAFRYRMIQMTDR